MDEGVSYDDDGNPVIVKTRPPRPLKPSKSFSGTSKHNDSGGSTKPKLNKARASFSEPGTSSPAGKSGDEKLAAIFDIDGKSYDVTLEGSKISWVPVGSSGAKAKVKRRRSGSLIRRLSSLSLHKDSGPKFSNPEDDCCVYFEDIIGITFKRKKRDGSRKPEGLVQAFLLYTYERKDWNRLKERTLTFNHPSEDICVQWGNRIQETIANLKSRPKRIKVFLQPHAGKKAAKSTYSHKIRPLFEAAGIEADCLEIAHNEHIRMEFCHFDLNEYDGVVCVGGDGTASRVVNGLLNRIQEVDGIEMRTGVSPHKSRLPVGIIPLGTTNQIAHSIHGTDDPVTAAIHVILGHKISVNVCSIFHQDKFLQWAFNCHYGFFGTVLKLLTRYSLLGDKKLEAAFMKSLTTKKFRAYECDIKYIPAGGMFGQPDDGNPCHRSCDVCAMDPLNESRSSTYSDVVETIDPLNQSTTSSMIIDLSNEKPTRTVKGEYISLSLMSMTGHSDLAPLGMSMFTHLNDGCIDLILVKSTDRHEFVRYLKRHGNKKNQLDFPFIETHRCKEIHFHIRLKETWKHKDHDYNDIDYEVTRRMRSAESRQRKSIEVIDDMVSDEDNDDDDDDDDLDCEVACLHEGDDAAEPDGASVRNGSVASRSNTPGSAGSRRSHSRTQSLANSRSGSRAGSASEVNRTAAEPVPWSYRPTLTELDKARRKKAEKKKDMKKKAKAEAKMKALWNMDNEISTTLVDLQYRLMAKCHKGILQCFGQGINIDYEPDEVKMNCLSVYRSKKQPKK